MNSKYVGLDQTDIAACYRHRAAEIADDKMPKPLCAVIVEFNVNQIPTLILFGDTSELNARENTSLLLETIGVIAEAAADCNAQAAN